MPDADRVVAGARPGVLIVGRRIPGVKVDAAFVRHASQRCVALLVDGLRAPP